MILKLFVDMDGVLCNFHKRFKEVYRKEPDVDYLSDSKKNKIYRQRFKDFISNKNFANLEPMPDMELGLNFLKSVSNHIPVNILSSTACEEYFDELSEQKVFWLNKYNIDYNPIFVPGKRLKQQYSKPGYVLIDDTVSNIDEWISMGGIGILHRSWQETIKTLTNM